MAFCQPPMVGRSDCVYPATSFMDPNAGVEIDTDSERNPTSDCSPVATKRNCEYIKGAYVIVSTDRVYTVCSPQTVSYKMNVEIFFRSLFWGVNAVLVDLIKLNP